MRFLFEKLFLLLSISTISSINAQNNNTNSDTRKFINNADFVQVNKDWNVTAEFKSGLDEEVAFFPVEAINLKTNEKVKSLQMDMAVRPNYFKTSWLDLNEVEEFIYFIEQYVIPNLKDKTEKKQSTTYIFNSKEMTFSFYIEKNSRRISIYLKDNGITHDNHYFWTESHVNRTPDLLAVLKQIK